ncbi:hypothetical protein B0H13DRAFT_1923164 [Mycena leptocephala]|nr:hypothetical protein B0H13DRAFT_1923164 [Mycena leptocephala]
MFQFVDYHSAAAVRRVLHPEDGDRPPSEDDLERLENAAFGGAKAAALAGAIFENAIEKRGQGDQVELFLLAKLEAGAPIKRFAKTNQTRFGSHGDAACELIARRDIYWEFLQAIKDLKTRPGWTNIEKNVYNALDDGPTLTELAVICASTSSRATSFPSKVASEDFSSSKTPPIRSTSMRIGRTRFLEGAKSTWIRFSSEFAPGGLIDGLNDDEKGRIWLPATNDRNEGALGSFIVYMRGNPTAALATHNGLAMFKRNETQMFMDTWFTPDDHQYVMKAAQELDAAGLERERKCLQMEYNQRILAEKAQKVAEAAAKEAQIQQRLDATALISRVEDIYQRGMTKDKLQDQLEKLRRRWNTKIVERIVIPKKSHIPKLADKQRALVHAFQEHLKLLETSSNQEIPSSSSFSGPAEVGNVVREHYDGDDEDFGQFDDDAPIF